jgi:hypothetical protein
VKLCTKIGVALLRAIKALAGEQATLFRRLPKPQSRAGESHSGGSGCFFAD